MGVGYLVLFKMMLVYRIVLYGVNILLPNFSEILFRCISD